MRYRRLTSSGDCMFGKAFAQEFLVDTPETVAQAVMTSLKLFQGEWFLDTTQGVPWVSEVLGKGTQPFYDQTIKDAILNTQGVKGLSEYSSFLDNDTRQLRISCTIDTIYGEAETSGVFGPKPAGFGLLDSTFILDQSLLG